MQKQGENYNDYAHKKFVELRNKLKLDVQKPILKETIQLTQKKMDEMSDLSHAKNQFQVGVDEAVEEVKSIDNTFNFIDSLQLPPKLSLAIGLIISGHKTNNGEDINKAREILKEVVLLIGYGGNINAEGKEEINSEGT